MKAAQKNHLPKRRGCIFVISAPSGTGKSTLIKRLRAAVPGLAFSISYTTRPPRTGERNGREYFFISGAEFEQKVRRKEFAEWARVHGHNYGTACQQLRAAQKAGRDILLDIDVQGHRMLKKQIPEAVGVFVLPPSFEELEQRLRSRHKDGPEVIANRLDASRKEMARWKEYDYLIVNDSLPSAVRSLESVVRAARTRRECQQPRVREIYKTFIGG